MRIKMVHTDDTESQLFLDEALAEAGVDAKVRRIVQAIFAAPTGVVRIRQADGIVELSNPFNIARGVLQGDIFSPIAFIAGLDRIFRRHDVHTAGVTVGSGDSSMKMSKFEYADDAALVDDDAATATTRVTAIAAGCSDGDLGEEQGNAYTSDDQGEWNEGRRGRSTETKTCMR